MEVAQVHSIPVTSTQSRLFEASSLQKCVRAPLVPHIQKIIHTTKKVGYTMVSVLNGVFEPDYTVMVDSLSCVTPRFFMISFARA